METESTAKTENQVKEGGNKKKASKVVIGVAAVGLAAVLTYLLWPKEEPRNVVLTKKDAEEQIANFSNTEDFGIGMYTVTMNNEWDFADGMAISENAYVENVEDNSADVYFDVFLSDADTENEDNAIYKSPVIPRGGYLENISLDKDLEPGTYDCVCVYHLIDDDQNTLSTLRVSITINIQG